MSKPNHCLCKVDVSTNIMPITRQDIRIGSSGRHLCKSESLGMFFSWKSFHRERPFHNFIGEKIPTWVRHFYQWYFPFSCSSFNWIFSVYRNIYLFIFQNEISITTICSCKNFKELIAKMMFDYPLEWVICYKQHIKQFYYNG